MTLPRLSGVLCFPIISTSLMKQEIAKYSMEQVEQLHYTTGQLIYFVLSIRFCQALRLMLSFALVLLMQQEQE